MNGGLMKRDWLKFLRKKKYPNFERHVREEIEGFFLNHEFLGLKNINIDVEITDENGLQTFIHVYTPVFSVFEMYNTTATFVGVNQVWFYLDIIAKAFEEKFLERYTKWKISFQKGNV